MKIPVIPCPTPFIDHVAGQVDGIDLPLRVWPAVDKQGEEEKGLGKRPWVLWIHGVELFSSAFMYGKHYVPNVWVIPAFRSLSYHVVSVSYRFVPQVTHDDIASDILTAYEWCKTNLSSVLGEENVDTDSFICAGDSAGAHLALWCGNHLSPRPRVVVDIYGLTSLDDPFYSLCVPDLPLPTLGQHSTEELESDLNDRDPANAVVTSAFTLELPPFTSGDDLKVAWGIDYTPTEKDVRRADLNVYTFKNGLKMANIFRKYRFEAEEEYTKELQRWSAMHHIGSKSSGYPATVIVHGKADTIVPVTQSHQLAAKLRKMGVDVEENYIDGADHLFETYLAGPEDPMWEKAVVPVINFVRKHLG
ncbi:uncharacterized protein I303_106500 [Kwoniella dejecticola CBS 10117]|uniref:Alpha/beta hydrolase fold-3 domain-containing protein n=1 Tax=Kwoniella dejecticola CBS 10117 TaxID=1296121 RepID=A0A1A5ZUJ0_9TREE|nr:uncharacterized protein I303_08242 [Kwoniella dejecticola CBS 10117]OBR81472.1 hypothetical protein I303_08242 [Kwoniella dejecticola CBS 10117]